jgi:hypothetical protein
MWGGQDTPAAIVAQNIQCDNGLIHIVDQVLMPYEGDLAPKITFIGARDISGDQTLQQDYYGDLKGVSGHKVHMASLYP